MAKRLDGKTALITNAVLWLASDESRNVTGMAIPVDAGVLVR
jgi:NAD(P)-dependent dehydrogenase (short-subunit alcohol dehydrogenase family)